MEIVVYVVVLVLQHLDVLEFLIECSLRRRINRISFWHSVVGVVFQIEVEHWYVNTILGHLLHVR